LADQKFMAVLLDSLKEPLLFADTGHIIRYMNKAARSFYKGGEALLGRSLFDCHNEESRQTIIEILEAMKQGLDEHLYRDNEKHRVFMRAVRDEDGSLLGYYERYEPPRKNDP